MSAGELFDTHAHVQFNAYRDEKDAVIAEAQAAGVSMILPGTQQDTSRLAVETAESYESGVNAAVGLHPLHLLSLDLDQEEIHFHARAEKFDRDYYATLAQSKKVVAIGECGLEYYRIIEHAKTLGMNINEIKKLQHETYEAHLSLAQELCLPVISHCRASEPGSHDAYEDLLTIMRHFPRLRGVVHCYTSDRNMAEKFLELGLFISFTGIITFTKDEHLLETVRNIPMDRILIETDAPYLAPNPYRGKRNHPMYVRYVAKKIASLRQMPFEEVARITSENAKRLFQLE